MSDETLEEFFAYDVIGSNDSFLENISQHEMNTTATPAVEGFRHMYVYLPIQILLSFVAVVANLLTILALNRVGRRLQPHLILVVNLALSDMLFGVRNVIIRSIMLELPFNPSLKQWFALKCRHGWVRVVGSAIYTCTYLNLIAMAFDLYLAIMKPFSYQKWMTRKRSFLLCASLWIASAILASTNYIAAFFHWLPVHGNGTTYCEIRERFIQHDVYVYLAVVYGGMIAMTYCYLRVFIEVRRCARYTPGLPVKKQEKVKQNKRKIITSLLVLLTFIIAWLPNGIFTTLHFTMDNFGGRTLNIVGEYFGTLPMINSICDPAIYAIRLDKVRIGFRKLCRCPQLSAPDDHSELTEQMHLTAVNGEKRRLTQISNISNGNGEYVYEPRESI